MVHQGCQEGLPKLDPEADLSAIQLVSPETTKEEILSLYQEVYKQQRLPGSPAGGPELMQEVLSTFEGCQGQREDRVSSATVKSQSKDPQPSRGGVPGEKETSVEWSLANMRKAHQKALTAVAALEGEIERLCCPLSWRWPEARGSYGRSRVCRVYRCMGHKKRRHQVSFSNTPTSQPLTKENVGSTGEALAPEDLDLGEPPELEPRVTSFLTGSVESSEEEESPPEPPVGELCEWVMWKAEATKTPNWWRVMEIKETKYHCHAPPAPPCLLKDHFLLPPIPSSPAGIFKRYGGRRP